jgi:type VI secretion system protein ImpL
MFAWLKRVFWVLVGLVLIGLFIWKAGPYFAFGDIKPLYDKIPRLIAIGVVVGCWLLLALVKRFRAYRASDKLVKAVIAQPQPEPTRVPSDVAKLRERFEEGVAALKQQRRSGHSLYELPWYVIIGAPGSGKTTALLNAGLKLPLEQRGGKAALRGVGGTRNCDWWFTDEAIFLDTAGRYTTQDSDAGSDSAGWSEFLALLRQHRARRPINGVILTINAQDLLAPGGTVREAHVEAAQRRLDELTRELGIQLPVYVMVTKCDLVAGFVEYFDDLTADTRAQVWGVTFPYEQTLSNDAPRAFAEDLDALVSRLNERVYMRLNDVRDVRRRAKVFAFPQQMAAMRDALTLFVTDVFDTTRFDRQILLRGVYFTSGTQLGTPIDRLLGSLGRRFGASDVVPAPTGPAKTYFVERLVKDVLIAESGLAGINRRLEARKAAAQLGAYAATGVVAATGVAALSYGYTSNRDYLATTAAEIAVLEQVPEVTPASTPAAMVARFDAIKAIVNSSEARGKATWLPMKWGLYQARAINTSARGAYDREVDSVLLTQFGARMEEGVHASAADPERLFDYVKAYKILREPKYLTKETRPFLEEKAKAEWAPAGATGAELAQHFHDFLENSRTIRPLPLDPGLEARALNSIRRRSRPEVQYHKLQQKYVDATGVRLDEGALDIDKVFRRASGASVATPIPALYSKVVFKQFAASGLDEVKAGLAADSWVWGESKAAATSGASAVLSAVLRLYEKDYGQAWDDVLNDLELVPLSNVTQIKEVLRILTSPTSPLRGVIEVAKANTTLTDSKPAPANDPGIVEKFKKGVGAAIDQADRTLNGAKVAPNLEPGRSVTARFQDLRDLTAGDKDRLAEIEGILRQILQQLEMLGPNVGGAEPMQIMASVQFRELTRSLRQEADTLPYSLKAIVSQLAGLSVSRVIDETTRDTEALYRQQVVQRCEDLIGDRYPFGASPQREVQLRDFTTVFGPDGVFDRFFKEHLQSQVDASGNTWEWKADAVRMPRSVLDQFQAALRLKNLFFPEEAKSLAIDLHLTPSDLDSDTNRFVLDLDGQRIEYKPDRPAAWDLKWPGTTSGSVLFGFESTVRYRPPSTLGGPWAWLKLIDSSLEGPADAQQRIRLNIRQGTHRVTLMVETPRAGLNPFATREWRRFSCHA